MVWVSGETPIAEGDIWVVDLATMVKRRVAHGAGATFVDNEHIRIARPRSNESDVLDLVTGDLTAEARTPTPSDPIGEIPAPSGYTMTQKTDPLGDHFDYVVTDPSGTRVLRFEAALAQAAGLDTIVLTTGTWQKPGETTGTNLFLLHLDTGRAEFIATSLATVRFAANSQFVVWTEDFCSLDAASRRTFVYDRSRGTITLLDVAISGYFTADGWYSGLRWRDSSEPSLDAVLVDLRDMRYRWVIRGFARTNWSPDGRYGSRGQAGGVDGPCI